MEARVYQSGKNDTWIFFDGENKVTGLTEIEARQLMTQLKAAQAIIDTVKSAAFIFDNAKDLEKAHSDIGNNTAPQEVLDALGIDQATLDSFVNFLTEIENFAGNQDVLKGDYRSILNKARWL